MGPGGISKGSYDPNKLSQDQKNWLFSQFGHSGQAPSGYGGENANPTPTNTPTAASPTTSYAQDPAQVSANYQQGINTAVTTLQNQGKSLHDSYGSLLSTIMGQGTQAVNVTTGAVNSELSRRGITSDSLLYGQTMGSAIAPIEAQYKTAEVGLGSTELGLQNELAGNIAALQGGGAGTLAQLPLSFGSLALSQAANVANIAKTQAETKSSETGARYVSTPYGLYDTQTNQFVSGNGNLPSGGQVVQQNGKYYLSVP